MDETLKAVRSGDVPGKLMIGRGKFYLEIGSHIIVTQILVQEPKLQEVEEGQAELGPEGIKIENRPCEACGGLKPHLLKADGSWLCLGCLVRGSL
jgi:hypothetical protein